MSTRDQRVKAVFDEAAEIGSPADRQAFLDRACAGDSELRHQVEGLLRAYSQAGSFLERRASEPPDTGEQGSQPAPSATADLASTEAAPGSAIGPYKLLQEIGQGGMGAVFMAEQEHPIRRRVALKIIKPGMDTMQVIARFEAERQALALMDHPNIAHVLDAGATSSGRPYFVMELVKGVPITEYCDQNRLDPKERLELFLPVCQAIQHAHQKGIIHRDIKPSNILITLHDGKPVPKVIDFGIAKAIDQRLTERTLFTQLGAVIGTPEYMSPEQAGMSGLDIDTRSDIYSLGVLLYELLTGSTPLRRGTIRQAALNEMLRRIKEEEPPKPSTRIQTTEELPSIAASRHTEPARLSRLVRGELDWIVMRCLEKDRTRRYETASGLARDLERYLHDEPVEAGPPSATYKLKKYALKHRSGLAIMSAFAAVLLLATATSTWQAYLATRARNDARVASELSRINEAKAKKQESLAEKSAAESRAVLRFFQEKVLAAARPKDQDGGLGKDATIRQAIEAAEPHIVETFKDRPTVEASIRDALGITYHYLGEDHQAIHQLEQSHQIRTKELGVDHPDTLTSMNNLGTVLDDAGRPEMALPLLQETLELRKAKLGSDHEDTIETMDNLANLYHRSGRFSDAIALHSKVLELRKKILGPTHPDTLLTTNNLAVDFQAAGRYADALPLLAETLRLRRAVLGPEHPYTIGSMDNLANLYHRTERLAEAIALHTEVLELRKSILGLDHPDTLLTMNNLAEDLRAVGRPAEAAALHEQTLAMRISKLGPEHPYTLGSQANLARAYCDAGLFSRAESILRQCLTIRQRIQPEDWITFSTRSQLGGSLLGQKKYAEAEPLIISGYEGMTARESKIPPPGKPRLTEAADRVVKLYEAWGKKDKAAEWRAKLAKPSENPTLNPEATETQGRGGIEPLSPATASPS